MSGGTNKKKLRNEIRLTILLQVLTILEIMKCWLNSFRASYNNKGLATARPFIFLLTVYHERRKKAKEIVSYPNNFKGCSNFVCFNSLEELTRYRRESNGNKKSDHANHNSRGKRQQRHKDLPSHYPQLMGSRLGHHQRRQRYYDHQRRWKNHHRKSQKDGGI